MEKFIQKLAKDAGALALSRFGKDGLHYLKSNYRGDAVTKADIAVDKLIVSRIKKAYPTHGIISEEGGSYNEEAEYVWVADPIDGTLNFSLGVPMFGSMICLKHRGEIILSAISIPISGELFFAKAGKGAFLNSKRIHCSKRKGIDHSYGASSTTLNNMVTNFFRNLLKAADSSEGAMFSSLGSMAVNACYVACGRRDWMVAVVGQNHDFAPVSLILKEAGCKVTDTKGRPWKYGVREMVAANPRLHKELLKLTKKV